MKTCCVVSPFDPSNVVNFTNGRAVSILGFCGVAAAGSVNVWASSFILSQNLLGRVVARDSRLGTDLRIVAAVKDGLSISSMILQPRLASGLSRIILRASSRLTSIGLLSAAA